MYDATKLLVQNKKEQKATLSAEEKNDVRLANVVASRLLATVAIYLLVMGLFEAGICWWQTIQTENVLL
jgi:hypothetical protein